ncbi:VOC family protein [Sphingomonas sp.]|uniref:VOC family protein n=1 Tax=Sphingomonas sp. TaxID=28214 RepID=UPI0038B04FBB
MTDVRDEAVDTAAAEPRGEPRGDFIWYELMTPDPEGAKAFYDAVVGWDIGPAVAEYNGYRMIGRSDGKFAGGVLQLTDEMQQHGARPTWLGYILVPDVDRSVAAIEQAGGKTYVAATDIPNVGRIAMVADPQGAAFYVMKPLPPQGDPNAKSDVFSTTEQQRVGWNELSTSDPLAARRFYGEQFGWTSEKFMPMGEQGEYRFLEQNGVTIGAVAGTMDGQPPHWRYYFRVPSITKAKETSEAKGGKIAMGPMEVPGGDHILIGVDPQGVEFALVGRA